MSYEKVQSLTIKKDGTMTIRSASSNVSPIQYYTSTLSFKGEMTFEEKLNSIFEALLFGSWQFNPSTKSQVCYAHLKAMEYFDEKYELDTLDLIPSEYMIDNKLTKEEAAEIKKTLFSVFQSHMLASHVNLNEKKYGVKIEGTRWLHKSRKNGYSYSNHLAKKFTIIQALMFKRKHKGEIVTFEREDE